MLLNFHNPGPLANSLLISMFRNIDLWSGAFDVRISVLLMQQDRGREIRKKSILDFKFKGFDSYIKDFCGGMDLSINIDKIEFFHEILERISIACSFPRLATSLIDWVESSIPISRNNNF